jgi:hypothetical protein
VLTWEVIVARLPLSAKEEGCPVLELLVLLLDPVSICILISIAMGALAGLAVGKLGYPDFAPYFAGGTFLVVVFVLLLRLLLRDRSAKKGNDRRSGVRS